MNFSRLRNKKHNIYICDLDTLGLCKDGAWIDDSGKIYCNVHKQRTETIERQKIA